MNRIRLAATAGTALLIVACRQSLEPRSDATMPPSSSAPVAAQPTPAGSGLEQQTATVQKRMQEHFAKAADMKAAVIRGDLWSVERAAAWLADDEWTPRLRPDWRPYMTAMQLAARTTKGITNTAQAAQALSRVGRACANCHESVGGPNVAVGVAPEDGAEGSTRLLRHGWAAERMWEGLTLISDEAWIRGASVLSDATLEPLARKGEGNPADARAQADAKELASKVHEIGRIARAADVQQRRALYADLLATCSDCHAALGVVRH